jgi:hemerythrin superfamily protein
LLQARLEVSHEKKSFKAKVDAQTADIKKKLTTALAKVMESDKKSEALEAEQIAEKKKSAKLNLINLNKMKQKQNA